MDLSYILNQLGEEDRERHRGAVAPPVYQTSIFAFPTVAAMREGFRDELDRTVYTRGNNPTVEVLRKKLAALEGAEDALLFGSGAAAIAAGVIACVAAGDHVVCVQKPYSWTRTLLRELLGKFGVTHSFVDATSVAKVEAALTPRTRLIVLESPNTMTFEQQDLAAVAQLARGHGLRTLVDNSYATPLHQQPIALGIDLVAHSATKYLNGHSDVLAGVLVCREDSEYWQGLRKVRAYVGGTLGSFESWLLARGLRTLHLRVRAACASAQKIAEHFAAAHPHVAEVLYPGLQGAQGHEIALRQMHGGFGGMLSVRARGGEAAAIATAAHVQMWKRATSLGGTESLIEHRASVEGAGSPVPADLLRLSVGLEHVDDLIGDLEQALARAHG